jgi:hypothetical protein
MLLTGSRLTDAGRRPPWTTKPHASLPGCALTAAAGQQSRRAAVPPAAAGAAAPGAGAPPPIPSAAFDIAASPHGAHQVQQAASSSSTSGTIRHAPGPHAAAAAREPPPAAGRGAVRDARREARARCAALADEGASIYRGALVALYARLRQAYGLRAGGGGGRGWADGAPAAESSARQQQDSGGEDNEESKEAQNHQNFSSRMRQQKEQQQLQEKEEDEEGCEPPRLSEAWRLLVRATLRHQADLWPNDWAQVLYAAAKMGRRDPELLAAALRHTAGRQSQMGEAALANAVWALAVLGAAPAEEWLGGACGAAVEALGGGDSSNGAGGGGARQGQERQPSATAEAVAEAARSEAGAAAADKGRAAAAAADSGEAAAAASGSAPEPPPPWARRKHLNRHQLVQLLWSLAKLGHRAPPGHVAALLSALRRHLGSLSASELTNLAWALGALRFRPSRRWLRAFVEATLPALELRPRGSYHRGSSGSGSSGGSGGGSGSGASGLAGVRAWGERRAAEGEAGQWDNPAPVLGLADLHPGVTPAQLATLLASLATLRVEPPPRWQAAARAALRVLCPDLRPRQMRLVLWALAKLRLPLPPYWLDLLARRTAELVGAVPTAPPPRRRHGLRSPPPPPAPPPAAPPATPHLVTDRDLACIVWALPLAAYPEQRRLAAEHGALLHALAALSLPRLGRMALAELVLLAVGFSRMRFYPGLQWIKSHENACAAHYGQMDRANRARLREASRRMWAL